MCHANFGDQGRVTARLQRLVTSTSKFNDDFFADIVSRAGILLARVAESDNKSVE